MLILPNKDSVVSQAGQLDTVEQVRTVRTELAKSTPFSRSSELLVKLNDKDFDPYALAYRAGVNVTTFLEALDPSKDHENSNTDAFERVVKASGLRMASDSRRGLFAHKLEDFERTLGTKRLVPELLARCYRSGINGYDVDHHRANAVYLSSDYAVGTIGKPWATRQQAVLPVIQSAIPLAALVAITTGINSDDYRGFYVDAPGDAAKMKRVTELAELPRTRIKGREQPIKLYKYGRAIELSYETLRRMQIDMLSLHLQLIAAQAEADKVAEVLDVLINGDGNNNAITTVNLTTLDPNATPGNLTVSGWLGFEMEFETPYMLTTILAQKGPAKQVRLLNVGNANIPLQQGGILGLNNFTLINRTADNVQVGWTGDAPANKLVGVDTTKAVERVYEIGASISEVDRFITRQSEVLTLSETEGYGLIDKNARKALNLAA